MRAACAGALVLASTAAIVEAQQPPVDTAAEARRAKVLARLPVPVQEALAAREDRSGVLDGVLPLATFRVHGPPDEPPPHPVGAVAFAADGRTLLAVGSNGDGRTWTVATGEAGKALGDGRTGILDAAFAPKGDDVATVGPDYTLRVWAGPGGRETARGIGHEDAVYGVAWSPDGKRLATAGLDGKARIWDARTGQQIHGCSAWAFALRAVAFAPDGKTLATGGETEVIQLWDVATGREAGRVGGAAAGAGGTEPGETPGREAGTPERTVTCYALAYTADGKRLAAADGDGTVRILDIPGKRESARVAAHTGGAYAVDIAADGCVATGGAEGRLRLWRLGPDGAPASLRDLEPGGGPVFAVAFAGKLPLCAAMCRDGAARVYVVPELAPKR